LRWVLRDRCGGSGAIAKQEAGKDGNQKDRYDGDGDSYGSPVAARVQPDAIEGADLLFRIEGLKIPQDPFYVLIPIFKGLLQALHDDLVRMDWTRGIAFHRWNGTFASPLVHRLNDGIGFERSPARQHLVKDDADGKDIGPQIGLLAFSLFGRH